MSDFVWCTKLVSHLGPKRWNSRLHPGTPGRTRPSARLALALGLALQGPGTKITFSDLYIPTHPCWSAHALGFFITPLGIFIVGSPSWIFYISICFSTNTPLNNKIQKCNFLRSLLEVKVARRQNLPWASSNPKDTFQGSFQDLQRLSNETFPRSSKIPKGLQRIFRKTFKDHQQRLSSKIRNIIIS